MEKLTFGKFIAKLRKMKGMTQKELGEKLFVTDKTISRWECDESTPELSLIPKIAEIFEISTDELLSCHLKDENDLDGNLEQKENNRENSFNLSIEEKNKKFTNLTLISLGISMIGFIIAMICNLAFSKGMVAFFLNFIFCLISEICQICFTINFKLNSEEFENNASNFNSDISMKTIKLTFLNIGLIGFCLPLVTMIDGVNFGMLFEFWFWWGLLFASVVLIVSYVIFCLFIQKKLIKHNLITLTEKEHKFILSRNKLLKKNIIISSSVAVIVLIGVLILNIFGESIFIKTYKFDNCETFK